MEFQNVEGRDAGEVTLYALSTCGWCKKTRDIIDSLGVRYRYVYVDLLDEKGRNEAVEIIKKLNPNLSFPTVDVNGKIIVGFKDEELKELLKGE